MIYENYNYIHEYNVDSCGTILRRLCHFYKTDEIQGDTGMQLSTNVRRTDEQNI